MAHIQDFKGKPVPVLRDREYRQRHDALLKYIEGNTLRLTPEQEQLSEETARQRNNFMLSDHTALQLLANMVKMMNGKKTLDVGVLTGYSALSIALALPDDGRVVAMDVDDELPSIGRKYWKKAGVEEKIDFRLGPAVDTLQSLVDAGEAGTYDFAFIDADKENYKNYYELCLKLVRPGGIIAIDNVLWQGKVIIPEWQKDEATNSMRELNQYIHTDQRVDISMVLLGDGLTIAFKK